MLDTVITNGTVVNHDGRQVVDVGIKNGKIVAMGLPGTLPEAAVTINASGKFVIPGAIDPHVHLGLYTDWESDFETETRSGAIGGLTMFKHMLIHPRSYLEVYEKIAATGGRRSYIDFALDVAMIQDVHLPEIPEYFKLGVSSFKFLLAYKGSEGEELGIRSVDDGYLYHGARAIAELGYPANARLHCENFDIIVTLRDRLRAEGAGGLKAWMDARPRIVEATDAVRGLYLTGQLGCPACVVHISSAETVDAIAQFKANGVNVHAETTPTYLYFTYESPIGILGKYNPPIKDQESVDRLWRGIQEGTIDSIGTDHAWSPLSQKMGEGDIWTAALGFGGMGVMLPFMLSEGVAKGRISLERCVALTSYNMAKWYGFYPRKGAVEVGADADINVVDMGLKKTVTTELLNAGADWTVWDGIEMTGWPVLTMVRGTTVAKEGKVVARPGTGRYVPAHV